MFDAWMFESRDERENPYQFENLPLFDVIKTDFFMCNAKNSFPNCHLSDSSLVKRA